MQALQRDSDEAKRKARQSVSAAGTDAKHANLEKYCKELEARNAALEEENRMLRQRDIMHRITETAAASQEGHVSFFTQNLTKSGRAIHEWGASVFESSVIAGQGNRVTVRALDLARWVDDVVLSRRVPSLPQTPHLIHARPSIEGPMRAERCGRSARAHRRSRSSAAPSCSSQRGGLLVTTWTTRLRFVAQTVTRGTTPARLTITHASAQPRRPLRAPSFGHE